MSNTIKSQNLKQGSRKEEILLGPSAGSTLHVEPNQELMVAVNGERGVPTKKR